MGFSYSTYVAYGVRVEDTPPFEMEEKTFNEKPAAEGEHDWGNSNRVGFLHAGDYDRDMTFLVTFCKVSELGSYLRIAPQATPERMAQWDEQIQWAVEHNGFTPAGAPGWFVVTDCS